MSTDARRFAATPVRTASETWESIVELISKEDSSARTELTSVSGVGSCLIADETPADNPIVVSGNGPRLRIYCLYGEDAVVGDDKDESDLAWEPTEGDWKMRLPCSVDDLDWIQKSLSEKSKRITAYDPLAEEEEGQAASSSSRAQRSLTINHEVFKSK